MESQKSQLTAASSGAGNCEIIEPLLAEKPFEGALKHLQKLQIFILRLQRYAGRLLGHLCIFAPREMQRAIVDAIVEDEGSLSALLRGCASDTSSVLLNDVNDQKKAEVTILSLPPASQSAPKKKPTLTKRKSRRRKKACK